MNNKFIKNKNKNSSTKYLPNLKDITKSKNLSKFKNIGIIKNLNF